MSIQVIRGKVDTGERVYLSGEIIDGLNDKDEKELVDLGVCRYTVEPQPSDNDDDPDEATKTGDLPEGLVQVGRGSYQLPNGEKVQGKVKAIEALEAYNQELADKEPDAGGGPNTDLPL